MTSSGGERCASCLYWHRRGHEIAAQTIDGASLPDVGTCQFYPPRLVETPAFAEGVWPRTHETRWCGNWEGEDPDRGPGEQAEPGNVVPLRDAA